MIWYPYSIRYYLRSLCYIALFGVYGVLQNIGKKAREGVRYTRMPLYNHESGHSNWYRSICICGYYCQHRPP